MVVGTMNLPFAGGCVCGDVRYECSAEPITMTKCHCRDCQRITGGAYLPAVIVPLRAFKITKGSIQHFSTECQAGGYNMRGFCYRCGSCLTGGENPEKGIIGLLASSLDDPSWFVPQFVLFISDAEPWDLMDPNTPKYPRSIPSGG
jgi:hypothetical protein